jgi:DNA-binding NarL/FixJ family response regulator
MKKSDSKAKVLIVDDHPIVRQGLAQLLNSEPDMVVSAEAETARRAMAAITESKPDLAIVDITLQGTNGIELIKNIVAQWPELPILVLSMHDEALYAERALRAGAKGYVMKQEATEKLTGALRRILNGQIYVSEKLADKMMRKAIDGKAMQDTSPVAVLSDRELEVLQLIGQGHGTRQIAEDLNLSIKTIESHRAHIKEKLNLKTAPEMVRFAVQWVSQEAA